MIYWAYCFHGNLGFVVFWTYYFHGNFICILDMSLPWYIFLVYWSYCCQDYLGCHLGCQCYLGLWYIGNFSFLYIYMYMYFDGWFPVSGILWDIWVWPINEMYTHTIFVSLMWFKSVSWLSGTCFLCHFNGVFFLSVFWYHTKINIYQ